MKKCVKVKKCGMWSVTHEGDLLRGRDPWVGLSCLKVFYREREA